MGEAALLSVKVNLFQQYGVPFTGPPSPAAQMMQRMIPIVQSNNSCPPGFSAAFTCSST